MADVEMIALRNHTGSYGHVRKGTRFTVSEREARSFARVRSPLAEPYTGGEEEEPAKTREGDAVDLREVAVADLDGELAKVEDADLIRSMKAADDRKTAAPKYEARLAELEAE